MSILWFIRMWGGDMGGWSKNHWNAKIIAVDGWTGTSNDTHQLTDDSVKLSHPVGPIHHNTNWFLLVVMVGSLKEDLDSCHLIIMGPLWFIILEKQDHYFPQRTKEKKKKVLLRAHLGTERQMWWFAYMDCLPESSAIDNCYSTWNNNYGWVVWQVLSQQCKGVVQGSLQYITKKEEWRLLWFMVKPRLGRVAHFFWAFYMEESEKWIQVSFRFGGSISVFIIPPLLIKDSDGQIQITADILQWAFSLLFGFHVLGTFPTRVKLPGSQLDCN